MGEAEWDPKNPDYQYYIGIIHKLKSPKIVFLNKVFKYFLPFSLLWFLNDPYFIREITAFQLETKHEILKFWIFKAHAGTVNQRNSDILKTKGLFKYISISYDEFF